MTHDTHLSADDEAVLGRKWMDSREDAARKGRLARRAGKLAGASPYVSGSENDECWLQGFVAEACEDDGPVDPEFMLILDTEESPELDAAYRDGMRAAQGGRPVSTCPHPRTVGAGRYDSWTAGWFDMSQAIDN